MSDLSNDVGRAVHRAIGRILDGTHSPADMHEQIVLSVHPLFRDELWRDRDLTGRLSLVNGVLCLEGYVLEVDPNVARGCIKARLLLEWIENVGA